MVTETAINRKRARHAADLDRSTHGHVPTPPALAEILTGHPYSTLANLPDGAHVLEPSAGGGALARAILDAAPHVAVFAVEPHPGRAAELTSWAATRRPSPRGAGAVHVYPSTFEDFAAEPTIGRFDAVIMNPPWSTPRHQQLWAAHIVTAWHLLRPGGRIVAIVPDIMAHPGHEPAGPVGAELRRLVDAHGGTDSVDVARVAGSEAVRGGFPTRVCLLWLVRPISTPTGPPSWLLSPAPGDPVTVDHLNLGPTGAEHTPVQAYQDRWSGGQLRVIRLAGTCATCARLLWAHDDGREDASIWTIACSLTAEDTGRTGPPIGLCLNCGHDRERVARARQMAQPF